jgi:SH3 domain-containing YSC84-like protein 1
MMRANSWLLFLGVMTGVTFAQQPPPPPPPPPPVASQPGVQVASPQNNQQQPSQSPAQQNTVQPSPTPQKPVAQTPAQPSAPRNPTEPSVPAPQQQSGTQSTRSLPESDRIDAEKELEDIREKDDSRLRESKAVLKELLSGKVKAANSLLQQAKCVIVIPSVKKIATAIGMKYGRGVMVCHLGEDFNGPWSAPSMYALEGGNFGLQIGLQATDLVLFVMNERGVDSLLGNKVKLGGDLSVAAGPMGRTMEASTDLAMRAKILAYSRARGIFAGVALDGSTLRPDNHANEALYGRDIKAREIVRDGAVSAPANAAPLLQLLQESTRAASGGPTSGQRK